VVGDQRRRRLDAELVAEQAAEVVVDAQGVGGATGALQRVHQQRARPLPQRGRVRQCGELGQRPVDIT
jgi:hypothetical protein